MRLNEKHLHEFKRYKSRSHIHRGESKEEFDQRVYQSFLIQLSLKDKKFAKMLKRRGVRLNWKYLTDGKW